MDLENYELKIKTLKLELEDIHNSIEQINIYIEQLEQIEIKLEDEIYKIECYITETKPEIEIEIKPDEETFYEPI